MQDHWEISTIPTQNKITGQWSIGIFATNDHNLGRQVASAKGQTKEEAKLNAALITIAPCMQKAILKALSLLADINGSYLTEDHCSKEMRERSRDIQQMLYNLINQKVKQT